MMPLPGPPTDGANGTLLLAVLAAFLYLYVVRQPQSWRRTVVKTAGVALLGVLAFQQGGPILLVAALALGAAGDACLSRDGDRWFLAGLASFLASHVAYVPLFALEGGGLAAMVSQPWRIAAAVAMVAAVGALLRILWPGVPVDMRMPVAAYAAAILAMGLTSLTVPAPIIALGAALFMASDALLAFGRFRIAPDAQPDWLGPAVWVLYFAAQLTLTLGFLL